MKKQLLFVLMLMCSLSALAVKLPDNPYKSYPGSNGNSGSYTVSYGTTFVNQADVTPQAVGSCSYDKQNPDIIQLCEECCIGQAYLPCFEGGGTEETCGPWYKECYNACMGVSLPLDAPTAFLLALVAAYGAVAVYRKRMQQA